jgi:hypothetical protein
VYKGQLYFWIIKIIADKSERFSHSLAFCNDGGDDRHCLSSAVVVGAGITVLSLYPHLMPLKMPRNKSNPKGKRSHKACNFSQISLSFESVVRVLMAFDDANP